MKLKFVHLNNFTRPVSVSPHVHNCYEFVYYLDGQGISNCSKNTVHVENGRFINYTNNLSDAQTFRFGRNDCLLYPPGFVHDEQHRQPSNLVAVGFDPEDIPVATTPGFFKDYDLSILRDIEKIAAEYQEKNYLYDKKIEALLTDLFIQFNRKRNTSAQHEHYNPIRYAKSYINEYFTTNINLEELAASTGYSVSRFRELFRRQTGSSPKDYILDKRLRHAKTLLSSTDLPLGEIASLCGFIDYPQFNKFFNLRAGMNPKDYRKLHRQTEETNT